MALFTVTGLDAPPDLETVARRLGAAVGDVDAEFGVLLIDRASGTYCVRARADRVKPSYGEQGDYQGPWSSPEIAEFGPRS